MAPGIMTDCSPICIFDGSGALEIYASFENIYMKVIQRLRRFEPPAASESELTEPRQNWFETQIRQVGTFENHM